MLLRSKGATHLILLVFLSIHSLPIFAQKPTAKSNVLVNVTGCLRKSATSGGYYVSDQQGRTWELSSKKVDLAKHMFHTVSVSGRPSTESQSQEGKIEQGQTPEAGNQHFALDVTDLEMISPSCTR